MHGGNMPEYSSSSDSAMTSYKDSSPKMEMSKSPTHVQPLVNTISLDKIAVKESKVIQKPSKPKGKKGKQQKKH